MINPTEIYDALAEIAARPFDPNEFPFAFAEATAEISKLTQARWRRFVLRLLVRRHGAYLMLLAKGWRKKK